MMKTVLCLMLSGLLGAGAYAAQPSDQTNADTLIEIDMQPDTPLDDATPAEVPVMHASETDHDCPCATSQTCQELEMKLVDQTRMHDPERGLPGNCAQAAVATLLGLDLHDVPDFTCGELADSDRPALRFWSSFNAFIESRGLVAERIDSNYGSAALHLASGISPRGTAHMVVRRAFQIVHDPHPSRAGLTDVRYVHLLVPIDIARWATRTI